MDKLAQKLIDTLEGAFRNARLVLNTPSSERRLSGFLIWSGFRKHDALARQQQVHRVLEQSLSPTDRRRVSLLFPFTPEEWEVYEEDRRDEEQAILQTAATIRRERARRKRFLAGLKHAV